jgi:putative modified peptide
MAFKLPDDIVTALLDKLSSDDDFRGKFQADPKSALASLGFKPAAAAGPNDKGAWSCCQVSALASKESIKASRAALHEQLTSGSAAFNPISLSA